MAWFLLIISIVALIASIIRVTTTSDDSDENNNNSNNSDENDNKPKIKRMLFECVGEMADNDNGKNRQDIIKRITKNYKKEILSSADLFNGYSTAEIKEMYGSVSEFEDVEFDGIYKKVEYKGKPAYIILMKDTDDNYYEVANIAKDDISKFEDIVNNNEVLNTVIYVTGGKTKEGTYNDYGKEIVETTELNYGIDLRISFKNKDEK
jgi:hypothetical protein